MFFHNFAIGYSHGRIVVLVDIKVRLVGSKQEVTIPEGKLNQGNFGKISFFAFNAFETHSLTYKIGDRSIYHGAFRGR